MLLVLLMISAVVGYDRSVNYWEAFAPGRLLQRLDALTASDVQPDAVANALPMAQAKLDEDADDGDETAVEAETDDDIETDAEEHADDADAEAELEADSHSAEGHSGEDYERNYEQFVRAYFDRVQDNNAADDDDNDDVVSDAHAEDATADEDEDEDAAQLEGSVESHGEATNVQQLQKPKRQPSCQRVERNGQLCEICREPRNNEISETCSYSHEAQPEAYAYGSGTQYRRYRDARPPVTSTRRPVRSNERHTSVVPQAQYQAPSLLDDGGSLCERRMLGKSVCYDCKDSGGQRLRRCYDAATSKQTRGTAQPRNAGQSSQQSEQQEQRIYKRTISYSYARGSGQDAKTTTPPPPPPPPPPASNGTVVAASSRSLPARGRGRYAAPPVAV